VTDCCHLANQTAATKVTGHNARDLILGAFAGDLTHNVAEHLHQTSVAITRDTRIAGARGQASGRPVVQPKVQHTLSIHPRHRLARAGAHRHEQRILGVAEATARIRASPTRRLVRPRS
jgi:hypothetical protein